jgi:hypothetical protein
MMCQDLAVFGRVADDGREWSGTTDRDPDTPCPETTCMVTEAAPAVTKTAFVAEQLRHDPTMNLDAVNRAWKRAGHDGDISNSTYFKIKSHLAAEGLSRPAGANRLNGMAGIQAAAPAPRIDGHTRPEPAEGPEGEKGDEEAGELEVDHDRAGALDGVEAVMDHAIFTCMGLGGLEEAIGHLRAARRAVVKAGIAAEVAE